tara:strand:+ start:422 stop:523 length:102 start_codon:yes stop_codon:yes gene_type:complete
MVLDDKLAISVLNTDLIVEQRPPLALEKAQAVV